MSSNSEYEQRQFWKTYPHFTCDELKQAFVEVWKEVKLSEPREWILYTQDPDIEEKINEAFKKEVEKQYGTK